MRKLFRILSICLLALVYFFASSQQVMAQKSLVTGNIFSLQLKGGLNMSQIKTEAGSFSSVINESLATNQGYVLGASLRLGRKLFIQPEVLFSQKGGQLKVNPIGVMTGNVFDMKYTTLDVPVLIGYKMGLFHIVGGPLFSNYISQDSGLSDALKNAYSSYVSGDGLKKSTLSYQVGAGVTLLGLTLDVRYEGGLQNIINTSSLPTYLGDLSQKPNVFQATLGIKIL